MITDQENNLFVYKVLPFSFDMPDLIYFLFDFRNTAIP